MFIGTTAGCGIGYLVFATELNLDNVQQYSRIPPGERPGGEIEWVFNAKAGVKGGPSPYSYHIRYIY